MDKYVCKECLDDKDIQEFIIENAVQTKCSYCSAISTQPIAAKVTDVASFIEKGLRSEYGDAVEWLPWESREGGWQWTTYDTYELLTEQTEISFESQELLDDLVRLLPDIDWCDENPYSLTEVEELILDWDKFSEQVKHKVRHVFFRLQSASTPAAHTESRAEPYEILYQLSQFVSSLQLSKIIEVGQNFYRVRLHDSTKFSTARDLGPPPKELARYSNRFSPAGIPMFYGSLDIDTAIAEVYDAQKKPVKIASVGRFQNLRLLHTLDLTSLPPYPGIFNGQIQIQRAPLQFLHHFVRDCTKSIIKDGREHVEYVPTQVAIEFFRYIFKDENEHFLDGIFYASAKREGGISCVLFCLNEDCTEDNKPIKTPYSTREAMLSLCTDATVYRHLPQ